MIRPLFLALLSTSLVSGAPAASQTGKARVTLPPAPAIVTMASPAPSSRILLQWMPGPVTCDGVSITGATIRRPWNLLGWSGTSTADRAVTLRFDIDQGGRAVSVMRDSPDFVPYANDIAPALVASRFAANGAHRDCRITYSSRATPLDRADVPELMSYTIQPQSGALPKEGWLRIRSAGGTCQDDPQPQPLVRVLPDFEKLSATPGARGWSMVRYDLDAKGKPVAATLLTGTANPALDAAALKAIRASRFTGGPRTGCFYPFWRAPATLPAPDMPEAIRDTKVAGNCPDAHDWATPPQLRFPEPFRRRSIEGWAVVSYDVAPWGELGNLKVIAAQPASDFGESAIAVLRSARFKVNAQGYTGCVDRVRFNMGPHNMPATDAPEAPPPVY
ncbi:TonB family protein [Sphingomonas pseudosanguinis]|uniref:TonB family protein n=1 Tax=Sphingomonas pseudosanguinis TaxID=413712 RepID=A0A7W6A9G0_9SPHN|nr:TonB family protein [Sphingomonas pseudosanguinis]MBB3878018.1 TonB family protein [Sphingomonas pseudosanguinis]